MPYERTGLTAGKHEISHNGIYRRVTDNLEITDYEAGGVTFDPHFEFGVDREVYVDVGVADGSAYVAQYDYDAGAFRLYDIGTGDEPADGETVNVGLRVSAFGRGP